MNSNINLSNESFNAGIKDIVRIKQSQATDAKTNTKKLTGSFNAGLKDLKIMATKNKSSQSNAK